MVDEEREKGKERLVNGKKIHNEGSLFGKTIILPIAVTKCRFRFRTDRRIIFGIGVSIKENGKGSKKFNLSHLFLNIQHFLWEYD